MRLRTSLTPGCAAVPFVALVVLVSACPAFDPEFGEIIAPEVRPFRDRVAQRNAIVELRLDQLLLPAMQALGIDCWLVVTQEGAPDPLLPHLVPYGTEPRGRAVLLLAASDGLLERWAIGEGMDASRGPYEVVEPSAHDTVADLVQRRAAELDPSQIAVNRSAEFPLADGLSASDEAWLLDALGPDYAKRLVSAAPLVEDLLGTYLDVERQLFAEAARLTVALMAEVLSDRVIVAGGTSVSDVVWAMRESASSRGIALAHQPEVWVQRPADTLEAETRLRLDMILQPGDLVFLSAGVRYLGYGTRLGRWVYLLNDGETEAPPWVRDGLGTLAGAVERAASMLQPGTGGELGGAWGQADENLRLGRVGYVLDGGFDPARSASERLLGRPGILLRDGSFVAVAVSRSFAEPSWQDQEVWLAALEVARVETSGGRLVVPPQRTPWLIR